MDEPQEWPLSASLSPVESLAKQPSTSTTHSRASDAEDDEFRKHERFLQLDMTPPAHLIPGAAPQDARVDREPPGPRVRAPITYRLNNADDSLNDSSFDANSSRDIPRYTSTGRARPEALVAEPSADDAQDTLEALAALDELAGSHNSGLAPAPEPERRTHGPFDSSDISKGSVRSLPRSQSLNARPLSRMPSSAATPSSELAQLDLSGDASLRGDESLRLDGLAPDSAFASRVETHDSRADGVRYRESVIRALKDENLELKLKIQELKDLGALPDRSRAAAQLLRAERRVDELEQALGSKNRTIAALIAENEQHASSASSEKNAQLLSSLATLQAAISELEAQAQEEQRVKQEVIARAHAELPHLVGERADTQDLVNAVRRLAQEAASLRAQVGALREATAAERAEHSRARETAAAEARRARDDADALRLQTRELARMHESAARSVDELREGTYRIIRAFFRAVIENADEQRTEEINARLQEIVAKCQRKRVSKTPYLIKYLVECTQQLAASSLYLNEQRMAHEIIKDKEFEVRSLEAILAQRFDKGGADAFLRSQVLELKESLKREQERRHAERADFVRTIAALQKQ